MPEPTVCDSTDRGTLRPNAPPIAEKGDHFEPMKIEDFPRKINLPSHIEYPNALDLFLLYYPIEIIESIVQWTNEYNRVPKDPNKPNCRANRWYETNTDEIYLFFGIRVHMTLHPEYEIADYWKASQLGRNHGFTNYMSKDRYLELHMRFRVAPPM